MDATLQAPHVIPSLAGPFAAVGLAGGFLVAHAFGMTQGPDARFALAFASCTALSAAWLGRRMSRSSHWLGGPWHGRLFMEVMRAGVMNSMSIGAILLVAMLVSAVHAALHGGLRAGDCWAKDWADDSVLHSIFSSRDSSHGEPSNAFGGAGSGWSIDHDGNGTTWSVTFVSPSAKCGTQLWRTKTFTVDASGTTPSGEACSSVTWPCNVGLPSTPVDSRVVVPAGWAGISALPGFDASSAVFMAENLYDCRNVNGEIVNRQDWELWSYWKQPEGTYRATARFNAAGKMTGVVGPCAYDDSKCLQQ